MGDIGSVILSICGLSVVCLGVIVVGGFVAFRVAGGGTLPDIFDALGGIMGGQEEDDRNTIDTPYQRRGAASSGDMKAKRGSYDFDAAVQRYRGDGEASSSTGSHRFSDADSDSDSDSYNKSTYGVRDSSNHAGRSLRDRRSRRDLADKEDELFNYLDGDEDVF